MAVDTELAAFQEKLAGLDAEITRLSQSEVAGEIFFRTFLDRIAAVLGEGGAVWRVTDDRELLFQCHLNLAVAGLDQGGRQERLLRYALGHVLENKEAVVLPARGASNVYDGGLSGAGEAGVNDSPYALMFVPILENKRLRGIFLLISPAQVDARAVRGFLGYVTGLCEKAGRYFQQQRIKQLEGQLLRADRWRQYVSAVHSELSPRRSCYALANYSQELLGVFRCMAGSYSSRGKFRLESVSGLESVAIKSSFMQQIGRIAKQVCKNGRPLVVDNPNAVMSSEFNGDELIDHARAYMLEAGSLILGVFPIHYENHVVGALIVEKAKDEPFTEVEQKQIDMLLTEAGVAVENGMRYRHTPLSWLTRLIATGRDRLYRMPWGRRGTWAAVILIVLVLPFIIQKQVKVIGTAELTPVQARVVYAQQEGVIVNISPVLFGDRMVKKGDVLASLDTRTIDSQRDRVMSEINETTIAYNEMLRTQQTTQARRLKSQLDSLQAEKRLYDLQREQYIITAPVDGLIITRQSDIRHLLSRPVRPGESVLEVVPNNSEWELKVNVPENEAAELLQSYDRLAKGEHLEAKVILNVCPDIEFETQVLSVAPRATVLTTSPQEHRNVIEVHLSQPAGLAEKVDPRQGMEGKAAVFCGPRSLFYVVTHEFINFIRINLF